MRISSLARSEVTVSRLDLASAAVRGGARVVGRAVLRRSAWARALVRMNLDKLTKERSEEKEKRREERRREEKRRDEKKYDGRGARRRRTRRRRRAVVRHDGTTSVPRPPFCLLPRRACRCVTLPSAAELSALHGRDRRWRSFRRALFEDTVAHSSRAARQRVAGNGGRGGVTTTTGAPSRVAADVAVAIAAAQNRLVGGLVLTPTPVLNAAFTLDRRRKMLFV